MRKAPRKRSFPEFVRVVEIEASHADYTPASLASFAEFVKQAHHQGILMLNLATQKPRAENE